MAPEPPDVTDGTPHDRFRFEYEPPVIRYGPGSADELAEELAEHGFERALVVCGSTVGETTAVIDPVTDGLGERLAGVFAETTPEKRLDTALAGRDAAREHDADVLVSLGGGSSLDVAKAVAVLAGGARDGSATAGSATAGSATAGDVRDAAAVGDEFEETGTLAPRGPVLPIVAVPTTLAGADLSQAAGLTADPASGLVDESVSGGLSDPRLMPRAAVYDPALFATTPTDVLAASAMNGFDKGIESLYARNATPITDGTAVRGLQLLVDGLQELGRGDPDPDVLAPVVQGIVLVQYGVGRPDGTTLSIVHAFGHGLTAYGSVQQGAAHGVVAPHVLRYLFGEVDARRDLLARGLGVEGADDTAEAIVQAVVAVRDALGLPSRLRDVDGPEPERFPEVAEYILDDSIVANAPAGLEPTAEGIEAVLEAAY